MTLPDEDKQELVHVVEWSGPRLLVRVGKKTAGVEYGLGNVVQYKKTKSNPGMETLNLVSLKVYFAQCINCDLYAMMSREYEHKKLSGTENGPNWFKIRSIHSNQHLL